MFKVGDHVQVFTSDELNEMTGVIERPCDEFGIDWVVVFDEPMVMSNGTEYSSNIFNQNEMRLVDDIKKEKEARKAEDKKLVEIAATEQLTSFKNTSKLKEYINKCIQQAADAENRKNDVKWEYIIIDNDLLFAIKSAYQRVITKVIYRLNNNLEKNFGLHFNLVHPFRYWTYGVKNLFDIYHDGIDANYSIMQWSVFGEKCTIRPHCGNVVTGGRPHLEKLAKHGYEYAGDNKHNWQVFEKAYTEVYGISLIEGYRRTRKYYEDKREKEGQSEEE